MRSLLSLACSVLVAVLGISGLALTASAVTRQGAATVVINSIILPDSNATSIKAFGFQAPLAPGVALIQGDNRVVATVGSTSWFFWIDMVGEADFNHYTRFVLVDTTTGAITLNVPGELYPGIGLLDYYRTEASRANTSPDVIYIGTLLLKAIPQPRKVTARPSGTLRVADPDPNTWGVLVTAEPTDGGANPGRKANMDSLADVMKKDFNVPPDHITTVSPTSKADLIAKLHAVMKDCPKLFFYWTGHGDPHTFSLGREKITDQELAHELKLMNAKSYCCILGPCYSGSFLPALRDSGIVGWHVASAESTEYANRKDSGVGQPFIGGYFEHYYKICLDKGLKKQEALDWADEEMNTYIDEITGNGSHNKNQHPKGIQVFSYSSSGQYESFHAPANTPSVGFSFRPGNAFSGASASVYCSTSANPGWVETKHWNWNGGQTRRLTPPAGGAYYKLVSHSNNYPVSGDIQVAATAVAETPSSPTTVPAYSLGWRDGLPGEFNPGLGLGGGAPPNINVVPGLSLNSVPSHVGENYFDFLDLSFPAQPDFARPFLYQGGNPGAPYTGPTFMRIDLADIRLGNGAPAQQIPIQVTLFQGPNVIPGNTIAVRQPDGSVRARGITFGPILAQPFTLRILPTGPAQKPGGPAVPGGIQTPGSGTIVLDAVVVGTATTGTLGVEYEEPGAGRLSISSPAPNPSMGPVRMHFSMDGGAPVTVGVYDFQGRLVRELAHAEWTLGNRLFVWDGKGRGGQVMPPGVYFARFEVAGKVEARKIALVR